MREKVRTLYQARPRHLLPGCRSQITNTCPAEHQSAWRSRQRAQRTRSATPQRTPPRQSRTTHIPRVPKKAQPESRPQAQVPGPHSPQTPRPQNPNVPGAGNLPPSAAQEHEPPPRGRRSVHGRSPPARIPSPPPMSHGTTAPTAQRQTPLPRSPATRSTAHPQRQLGCLRVGAESPRPRNTAAHARRRERTEVR